MASRMERCVALHSCSLACARLAHKFLSWDKAGIRIRSSGGLSTGFEADTCLACDPAPCAQACPTGAFSQRKGGGIVKKKLCIRCGECDRAFPVDAIYLDPSGEPFVCIHCGRCVPFCPHDCLELSGEAGTHHGGSRGHRENHFASIGRSRFTMKKPVFSVPSAPLW